MKNKTTISMHEPIGPSNSTSNQDDDNDEESLRKNLRTQEKLNAVLQSSLKDCKEEKKILENDLIKVKEVLSRRMKSSTIRIDEIEYLRSDNNRLHKEVESLMILVKDNERKSGYRELMMKRTLEDFNQMKNKLLECCNIKDDIRAEESNDLIKTLKENVSELENQKKELLVGFKKQMQLIDILKNQIEHLKSCTRHDIVVDDL